MLFLRKILFYLLTALYFVLCPLTILYALGYLFSPGTGQGIVKTGLISLSSAPPNASVYLENRRYTQKTPTVLRDLLPGNYSVKLVLKDHEPWVQTVPVEAKKATVLVEVETVGAAQLLRAHTVRVDVDPYIEEVAMKR